MYTLDAYFMVSNESHSWTVFTQVTPENVTDHEGNITALLTPRGPSFINSLLGTIQLLIILAAIIGNSLVLLAIARTKTLRKLNNYLLVSLAISDLGVAIFCMPLFMVQLYQGGWKLPRSLCIVFNVKDQSFAFVSMLTLTAISFERYFIISRPLKYHRKVTKLKMVILIVILWVVGFAYGSLQSLWFFRKENVSFDQLNPHVCRYNPTLAFAIVDVIVTFVLPLVVMCFAYARIYCIVHKQMKRLMPKWSCDTDEMSGTSMADGVSYTDVSRSQSRANSFSTTDMTEDAYRTRRSNSLGLKDYKYFHERLYCSRKRTSSVGASNLHEPIPPITERSENNLQQLDIDVSQKSPKLKSLNNKLCIPQIIVDDDPTGNCDSNEIDEIRAFSDYSNISAALDISIKEFESRSSSLPIHGLIDETPELKVIPDETSNALSSSSAEYTLLKGQTTSINNKHNDPHNTTPLSSRSAGSSRHLPLRRTSSTQKVEEWLGRETFTTDQESDHHQENETENSDVPNQLGHQPSVHFCIGDQDEDKVNESNTLNGGSNKISANSEKLERHKRNGNRKFLVKRVDSDEHLQQTLQRELSNHKNLNGNQYHQKNGTKWVSNPYSHKKDNLAESGNQDNTNGSNIANKIKQKFKRILPPLSLHKSDIENRIFYETDVPRIPQIQTILANEETTTISNTTTDTWISGGDKRQSQQISEASDDNNQCMDAECNNQYLNIQSNIPHVSRRGSISRLSSIWTMTSTTGAELAKFLRRRRKTLKRYIHENKAAKMMAFVIGAFIICWLPYEVCFLIRRVCYQCVSNLAWNIVHMLTFLSSAVNPFIYNFYSSEFREATKNAICCRKNGNKICPS